MREISHNFHVTYHLFVSQFGLSSEGLLQWQDCFSGETVVFSNATGTDLSFVLLEDASFNIFQNEAVVWKSECKKEVTFFPRCLSSPVVLACPYLHLHSSGGVVLNFVDSQDNWRSRNIEQVYPQIFGEE